MLDQAQLRQFLTAKSIPLIAYSPLAKGLAASDAALAAIGRKHNASAAQVALKWLLDQDGVAAIPKASRAESLKPISARSACGSTMRTGRRSRPCRRTNGV